MASDLLMLVWVCPEERIDVSLNKRSFVPVMVWFLLVRIRFSGFILGSYGSPTNTDDHDALDQLSAEILFTACFSASGPLWLIDPRHHAPRKIFCAENGAYWDWQYHHVGKNFDFHQVLTFEYHTRDFIVCDFMTWREKVRRDHQIEPEDSTTHEIRTWREKRRGDHQFERITKDHIKKTMVFENIGDVDDFRNDHVMFNQISETWYISNDHVVHSDLNGSQGSVGDKDDVELSAVVQGMIVARRVYDEVSVFTRRISSAVISFCYEPLVVYCSYASVMLLVSHPNSRAIPSFNRSPIDETHRHYFDDKWWPFRKLYWNGFSYDQLQTQKASSNRMILNVGDGNSGRDYIKSSALALENMSGISADYSEDDVQYLIGQVPPLFRNINIGGIERDVVFESHRGLVMLTDIENTFHENTMHALSRVIKIGKHAQSYELFWLNFLFRFYTEPLYIIPGVDEVVDLNDYDIDKTLFGLCLKTPWYDFTWIWIQLQIEYWDMINCYRRERYVWHRGKVNYETGKLSDNVEPVVKDVQDPLITNVDISDDIPELGSNFHLIARNPVPDVMDDPEDDDYISNLLREVAEDESPIEFSDNMRVRDPDFDPLPYMPATSIHSGSDRYSSGVDSGISQLSGVESFWSLPSAPVPLVPPGLEQVSPRPLQDNPISHLPMIFDYSEPLLAPDHIPTTRSQFSDEQTVELSSVSGSSRRTRRGVKAGRRHKNKSPSVVSTPVVKENDDISEVSDDDIKVPFADILPKDGKTQTKLYKAKLNYERWFRGKEFPTAYSSDPRDRSASGAGFESFSYIEVDSVMLEKFKLCCSGIKITGERTILSVRHMFLEHVTTNYKRECTSYEIEFYPVLALQHLIVQQITDNLHGMSPVYISFGSLNAMAPSSTIVEFFLSNIRLSRRTIVIISLTGCSLVFRRELNWLFLKALFGCFRLESTLRQVLHQIAVSERLSVPVQFIRDKHTGLLLPAWTTPPTVNFMTK